MGRTSRNSVASKRSAGAAPRRTHAERHASWRRHRNSPWLARVSFRRSNRDAVRSDSSARRRRSSPGMRPTIRNSTHRGKLFTRRMVPSRSNTTTGVPSSRRIERPGKPAQRSAKQQIIRPGGWIFQSLGDSGRADFAARGTDIVHQPQHGRECHPAIHRVIRDQDAWRRRDRRKMIGNRRDLRVVDLLPPAMLRATRGDDTDAPVGATGSPPDAAECPARCAAGAGVTWQRSSHDGRSTAARAAAARRRPPWPGPRPTRRSGCRRSASAHSRLPPAA